jgi:hypothetical protein
MVNSSSIAREELESAVVGLGDETKQATKRTDATRRKLGTDRLIDQRQLPPETDLPQALTRHGLRSDWESLMAEIERRGWYVIPTTSLAPAIDEAPTNRRVYVGMISNESHVTIDGNGPTIIEALGWAMVHALDATTKAEAS